VASNVGLCESQPKGGGSHRHCAGGIIPAVVALITARRTAGTELTKLSVGVQQKVFEQLVGGRLARYPELYWLLSSFRKSTGGPRPRTLDHAALDALLTAVNNWDSHNALFLGREAAHVCAKFRTNLWTLSETNRNATEEEIDELVEHSTKLELALRSDLGIYGIQRLTKGEVLTQLPKDWG
jgi:hypothetical protein